MNASEALFRLQRLRVPVVETADAAAALGQSPFAASKTLSRLAKSKLIARVRQGTWWIQGTVDPYRLPGYLTAPYDSYLSLQSALHLHGLIEQIPQYFFVVSLARTQTIHSSAGQFSIHHVAPELFGGFSETTTGLKIATPEKAIFDFAYLAGNRSRFFTALPELELPRRFRRSELKAWIGRISSARGRTLVTHRLEKLLAAALNSK